MKIILKEDGEGFLAKVKGSETLFAFGFSKQEALDELLSVVDMTMDFHLELVEIERKARQELLTNRAAYAL